MSVIVSGVAVASPNRNTDIAKVMADLQAQFANNEKVIAYLTDEVGVKSIEDFAKLFASPADIATLIEVVPDIAKPQKLLQTSRLRQAWEGVNKAMEVACVQQRKGAEDPDLDKPLGQEELGTLAEAFWSRYHLSFPPEETPADTLVSRIFRELNRHLLTVRDVWRVQPSALQVKSEKKVTEITDTISINQTVPEELVSSSKSVPRYLSNLWTLMLAYARAGATPRVDAPNDGEPRGSDSTLYVQVPLDVVIRYHRRAQQFALQLPQRQALAILAARDEAERRVWVDKYRNNRSSTLGEIISDTFDKREGVWQIAPEYSEREVETTRPQATIKRGRSPPRLVKGYCMKYNEGGCVDGLECPDGGKHRCNAITKRGTTCNMNNHRAVVCRNAKRQ